MNRTVIQLRIEAREKGIVGYSKMSKPQLLSILRYKGYINSWDGLEKERKEVIKLATQIKEQDKLLESKYTSAQIIGGTLSAVRSGRCVNKDFEAIGQAQQSLLALNTLLIHTHGLNFHFVRNEWVSILNPIEAKMNTSF